MTYLYDARVLPRFFSIPTGTGSDDLAISYLVGLSRLHICSTARAKYTVCSTMKMLAYYNLTFGKARSGRLPYRR
jgi:hypothetical protein